MTEYSNAMTACMNSLSQLSSMELINLAEAITKERSARADKECKEKIRTAVNAFNELSNYYDYLEIESENGMMEIDLVDILEALDKLYTDLC